MDRKSRRNQPWPLDDDSGPAERPTVTFGGQISRRSEGSGTRVVVERRRGVFARVGRRRTFEIVAWVVPAGGDAGAGAGRRAAGGVLGPESDKYRTRARGCEKSRAGRRLRAAHRRVSCRAGQIRTCEGARKTLARTLLGADAAGRPRTDEAEINHPRGKVNNFGKRSARRAERRTSWRRGGEAPRVARGSPRRMKKRGQTSPRVSSCELQSCAQREHVVIRSHQPAPFLAAEKRRRMTQPRERDSGRYSVAYRYWYHTRRSLKITRCD